MKQLLEKINSKSNPVLIPVRADKNSIVNNCFYNVADKVSIDGGKIVYGWKLHEGTFIDEAERHAVWESPDKELIDITPNISRHSECLFVAEDNGWVYNEGFVDNIRVNKTGSKLVDDYILLCETITKLWNMGKRKSDFEVSVPSNVAGAINLLEQDKSNREIFILAGNTSKCECYCGSKLRYQNCHGLDLEKAFNELLEFLSGS